MIELSFNHFPDCIIQLIISLVCRDFRVFGFDGVGALEEEACFACLDHAEVVVAVAAGDGVVADRLQGFDRSVFGFLTAHLEVCDLAVVCYNERVAEDSRVAEFFHQSVLRTERRYR